MSAALRRRWNSSAIPGTRRWLLHPPRRSFGCTASHLCRCSRSRSVQSVANCSHSRTLSLPLSCLFCSFPLFYGNCVVEAAVCVITCDTLLVSVECVGGVVCFASHQRENQSIGKNADLISHVRRPPPRGVQYKSLFLICIRKKDKWKCCVCALSCSSFNCIAPSLSSPTT